MHTDDRLLRGSAICLVGGMAPGVGHNSALRIRRLPERAMICHDCGQGAPKPVAGGLGGLQLPRRAGPKSMFSFGRESPRQPRRRSQLLRNNLLEAVLEEEASSKQSSKNSTTIRHRFAVGVWGWFLVQKTNKTFSCCSKAALNNKSCPLRPTAIIAY